MRMSIGKNSGPDGSEIVSSTLSTRSPQGDAARQEAMLDTADKSLALAQSCLPEIESFLARIVGRTKTPQLTGLPTFVRDVARTQRSLQSVAAELSSSSLDEETLKNRGKKVEAYSINLSHSAVHWEILKRCRSFVAVNQAFQGSAKVARKKEMKQMALSGRVKQMLHRAMKEQGKIEVDVVEGGREWVYIKTLQEDRLARQMTDSGWSWGGYEVGDDVNEQEWEDIPLAKQIKRLVAAAKMNRHEYRIPRVRVVLPNIGRGNNDMAVLLSQLSCMDTSVQVIIEDQNSAFLSSPPQLAVAIDNLIGDEFEGLTQTLNMDHTILVDLISDLTHLRLQPQPWQADTTRQQIEEELRHGGLMVRTLYPILDGRTLVCTRESAEHFHEVLSTVGTSTERERGRLLVPFDDETRHMPRAAIRARFQSFSVHPVPPSVQIPVSVIDEDWTWPSMERAVGEGRLPRVALDVARCGNFRSSKLSIYMHGWAAGLVTVTSNKEVRGQIRTWVEANRRGEDECGPRIWRVDVTRNLLASSATPRDCEEGVEKGGEESNGHDTG
ncbi:hypothetical protein TOPH_03686 [Tolypocladium ophioglossoides CBS 100239]|uniref:DUF1308 domain-containing protein n=1 Tax=Tolypocladium ophioglossoides (strain CBS 100239) TaxID=1163406 RepID=A0A0L0NBX2_TOLOC|nr:hypothetical protein TOPH_03686 [Tolypocladium ophioglossoides CBS 100239]